MRVRWPILVTVLVLAACGGAPEPTAPPTEVFTLPFDAPNGDIIYTGEGTTVVSGG